MSRFLIIYESCLLYVILYIFYVKIGVYSSEEYLTVYSVVCFQFYTRIFFLRRNCLISSFSINVVCFCQCLADFILLRIAKLRKDKSFYTFYHFKLSHKGLNNLLLAKFEGNVGATKKV